MYKYPLQTDNFSLWDRGKAAAFILNKANRLTFGPQTQKLEEKWEQITGSTGVATSSGSSANHLLVESFIQTNKINPKDIVVFAPSTTWSSSITPWIMRGCKIVFVDINLRDFSFNYDKLEAELAKKDYNNLTKVIWPTALIGSIPDIDRLKNIKLKNEQTFLFGDFCETTIGTYKDKHCISYFDMATTSFFWAHEICGIELGMLFINDDTYVNAAHSIRSHGLSKALPSKAEREALQKKYHYIDKEFMFITHGSNYRPTDLNSFFCLMDTARYHQYGRQRSKMWRYFLGRLPDKYMRLREDMIPFCLPFVFNEKKPENDINSVKEKLRGEGWEVRPIISFIPLNPAFKANYTPQDIHRQFPNSSYLHQNGFYVGLNKDLRTKDIDKLLKLSIS
tara:strand:- start:699 stop:1880 length:1182 start_codon:yes stop_codon:yes gene_type:complete